MKKVAFLLLIILAATAASAAEAPEHRLTVELDPATSGLRVRAEIRPPAAAEGQPLDFLLNAALAIDSSTRPLESVAPGDLEALLGPGEEVPPEVELARYRFQPVAGEALVITYGGAIDYGLSDPSEEYTRGFRETAGILSEEGVYLTGKSFWHPWLDDRAEGFELEVRHPQDWWVVSQGTGPGEEQGRSRWQADHPVLEGIYLVGGPLVSYRQPAGDAEAQVYLRQSDDALATQYLDTTAQYLEMYKRLLGPYPYSKFALVENFWETGYGMPSFTLLGPRVIRFPFILHSSYPHEILHNWWGNGVFVDFEGGNWSEGLTAYLADHLVKEQRGTGAEHRRATLQKYRDYVREGRDFALAEFRTRHSAASEAVGYGKTMMGFHMLRRRLGDRAFSDALRALYRDHKWRRASFADVQAAFEAHGEGLSEFFVPWVERPGAPALAVEAAATPRPDGGWLVEGTLCQTQTGASWPLDVPIVVETASGPRTQTVGLAAPAATFAIEVEEPPLRLLVDPWFDLFRLLDPRETPPSIGQIFGDPEVVAVLPAQASEARRELYRQLLEGWRSDSHQLVIVGEDEVGELDPERSVWLLGRDNRLAETWFADTGSGWRREGSSVALGDETVQLDGHSLVVVRRHPARTDKALGWLVVDPEAAFPGMGRKLPHYGKYSYLAFEGDEPTNTVKGQWAADDSPLAVDLRPPDQRAANLGPFPAESRTALAELPPLFSATEMMAHIEHLSSPELEGRGVGSSGLVRAADYVADRFAAYGLTPGGDDDGYFQKLVHPSGPDGEPVELRNVIGYLPGSRAQWSDQAVIVSAHYDHLGRGWPDVHAGDEGKIHPGADDNASGVAVLLELARTLAKGGAPSRTLVFAAFTAEEAGMAGSRHFVEHPTPGPLAGIRAVVNLDTVGRLFDGEVAILGTGTAEEWQHIFRGSSFVTGVPSRNVPRSQEASDQLAFIEKGIPGVQIFTRAHGDYHRPGDTSDKIDAPGLVKVTSLVKEGVVYLAEREEPLTVTIEGRTAAREPAAAPTGGRRVRFGTIPDFGFEGPGARVDSVAPDSPAERAGLEAGDVLLRIADREIADLRGYSALLRTLEPGQTVVVTVLRAGVEIQLPVTVEAR